MDRLESKDIRLTYYLPLTGCLEALKVLRNVDAFLSSTDYYALTALRNFVTAFLNSLRRLAVLLFLHKLTSILSKALVHKLGCTLSLISGTVKLWNGLPLYAFASCHDIF